MRNYRLDKELADWLRTASGITGQSQTAILEDAIRAWQPRMGAEIEKRLAKLRGLVPAKN